MDNEKLTDKVIMLIAAVARIEENTKFLPNLKDEFEDLCVEVQRNTAFRKNIGKFIWISISAFVTSVFAVIVSFVSRR